MAEISHLDELLSPTINISKQSKHKRKRASRNNEGRDDEAQISILVKHPVAERNMRLDVLEEDVEARDDEEN